MLMKQHDIGALPVVAGGRIVGIVTDRDIVIRILTKRSWREDHPVSDAMSPVPVTCLADQTVAEAAALMGDEQIRRIPVIARSGDLAGVLSIGDIAENVSEGLAGEVLGEISEERGQKARPARFRLRE
jgi:CBS domain-containing protein